MNAPWHADSMATPAPVTLVSGPEEFLAERAVRDVVLAARKVDPSIERRDVEGSAEGAAGLLREALSPTLFGDAAVVVVNGIEGLDDAGQTAVRAALADLPNGIYLVLVHPGGVKGKALLTDIRKSGAAEVDCATLKRGSDTIDFITREFVRHGRKATREAINALYESLGQDLRMLAAAVSQVCADLDEEPIDADHVHFYFDGVAEVSSFQIADAVWDRRPKDALRDLRWAMETGDRNRIGPSLVSGLSGGLRSLARYTGVSHSMSEGQIAGEIGVPPWKVKVIKRQAARWRPAQLAQATLLLAAADGATKGGVRHGESLDPVQKAAMLESLVVKIASPD